MASLLTRVPITVEATAVDRFIARADLNLEAKGTTAEAAVAQLQARGTDAAPGQNPWLAVAGMWKDTDLELLAEWRNAIEMNRQLRDRDEFPPEDWTQPMP